MKEVYSNSTAAIALKHFALPSFVQVGVYRIGVNCIRTSELQNNTQMKAIVNFVLDSDFNIMLQEFEFQCFFSFIHTEKL